MLERKGMFIFIWIILVIYGLFLSPKDNGATSQMISDLLKLHLREINPLVVMLFYCMGIWSMVYAGMLLIRDQKKKWILWLTVIASFFFGSYAILPYIAFKKEEKNIIFSRSKLALTLGSKKMGIVLTVLCVALFIYGFIFGSYSGFVELWLNNKFVNVMTLDFLTLLFLFNLTLKEDMNAREYTNLKMYPVFAGLPLLGACIYLIVRPAIKFKPMGRAKGGMIIDHRK